MSLHGAIYGTGARSVRPCAVPGCVHASAESIRYRFADGSVLTVDACTAHAAQARAEGRVESAPHPFPIAVRPFVPPIPEEPSAAPVTSLEVPMEIEKPTCRVGTCAEPLLARGLCKLHYARGYSRFGGHALDTLNTEQLDSLAHLQAPKKARQKKARTEPIEVIAELVGADPDGTDDEIVSKVEQLAAPRAAGLGPSAICQAAGIEETDDEVAIVFAILELRSRAQAGEDLFTLLVKAGIAGTFPSGERYVCTYPSERAPICTPIGKAVAG